MFSFAQADHPVNVRILARLLFVSRSRVENLLVELDQMGLVDAKRCRLTMEGLVVAASTRHLFSGRTGREAGVDEAA